MAPDSGVETLLHLLDAGLHALDDADDALDHATAVAKLDLPAVC